MIEAIAAYYHIEKNSDFANFFEISGQTAFQRRKQGIMAYEEIYRRCPDISPDWLLSGGEGPMLRADRIENNGNLAYGNNSRQIYKPIYETETVKKVVDALGKEQDALRSEQESLHKAQDQITGLIQILQTK